jgi:antitoxin FitA
MPTLTVRNLDEDLVRRLRTRAAAHGRSVEAEHREILRAALFRANPSPTRQEATGRLAIFRRRTAGRGSPSAIDRLAQSRAERTQSLTGPDNAA